MIHRIGRVQGLVSIWPYSVNLNLSTWLFLLAILDHIFHNVRPPGIYQVVCSLIQMTQLSVVLGPIWVLPALVPVMGNVLFELLALANFKNLFVRLWYTVSGEMDFWPYSRQISD